MRERIPIHRDSAAGLTVLELLFAVSLTLTMGAIGLAYLWKARLNANEATAVASLRAIHTAEKTYFKTYGRGFSDTLEELGPPSDGRPTAGAAGLLPAELVSGQKSGYHFVYKPIFTIPTVGKEKGKGIGVKRIKAVLFSVSAEPLDADGSGVNFFYIDETGLIRTSFRTRATPASPPL